MNDLNIRHKKETEKIENAHTKERRKREEICGEISKCHKWHKKAFLISELRASNSMNECDITTCSHHLH